MRTGANPRRAVFSGATWIMRAWISCVACASHCQSCKPGSRDTSRWSQRYWRDRDTLRSKQAKTGSWTPVAAVAPMPMMFCCRHCAAWVASSIRKASIRPVGQSARAFPRPLILDHQHVVFPPLGKQADALDQIAELVVAVVARVEFGHLLSDLAADRT